MQYSVTALLLAVAFAALAGCGQTGPLYMPPEEAAPVPPAVIDHGAAQQHQEP